MTENEAHAKLLLNISRALFIYRIQCLTSAQPYAICKYTVYHSISFAKMLEDVQAARITLNDINTTAQRVSVEEYMKAFNDGNA